MKATIQATRYTLHRGGNLLPFFYFIYFPFLFTLSAFVVNLLKITCKQRIEEYA